jgi:hypothetical protein
MSQIASVPFFPPYLENCPTANMLPSPEKFPKYVKELEGYTRKALEKYEAANARLPTGERSV